MEEAVQEATMLREGDSRQAAFIREGANGGQVGVEGGHQGQLLVATHSKSKAKEHMVAKLQREAEMECAHCWFGGEFFMMIQVDSAM